MSTINELNPRIDQTVNVFDSFYNYDENVPAAEYDAVLSYFKSVMNTAQQAENFTSAIFRIAQESGDNAMDILQQFYGQTGTQLTLSLCYYLNSTRSNATLLGMLQPTSPNYWTARNVRQ